MTATAPITDANPTVVEMEARVARFHDLKPTADYGHGERTGSGHDQLTFASAGRGTRGRSHAPLVHVAAVFERRILPALAGASLLTLLASCGDSPSYPRDWSPLRPPAIRIGGQHCPDLTGTYALPKTVPTHGAKRKGHFVRPHAFMGVNPFREDNGRQARSIPPPPKMRLEGPTVDGLRVIFFNKSDEVVTDRTIRHGVDFECLGSWIADTKPSPTRANPRHLYAKDSEGRLIGHKAFSGGGVILVLGVIPVPAFVDDHECWQIEPLPDVRQ